MENETAFVFNFLAFAVVWVFPIVIIVIVFLGARRNSAAEREFDEAHGDNVVPFPAPAEPQRRRGTGT